MADVAPNQIKHVVYAYITEVIQPLPQIFLELYKYKII